MAKQFLLLLTILTSWNIGLGQHNSYSLQSAVDALHRRENQLALKDNSNNNNNPSPRYPSLIEEQKYWNRDEIDPEMPVSPYRGNREQLNKLLANYLAREEDERDNSIYQSDYDEDDYRINDRKRSVFRERDVSDLPYQSAFREREVDLQPDLTEEFLRETENQRNLDREQNYREQLRRIWEKYQQQENEIEHELFDENEKKRSSAVPPQMYYPPFMAKKSYSSPLPWLPASRRKRFPVSKRSPKSYDDGNISGTNDKVNKDLAAIFGEPIEEKKKRSSGDSPNTTMKPEQKLQNPPQSNAHHDHDNHNDDDDEHDDHEHNNDHDDHDHEEHEEHDNHDEDDDDEHEHEFDESKEEDDKKKKRATKRKRSNLEIIKEDQIIPGDLTDLKKKSVQWSKYFGIDRRKKSEYSPSKYENYQQYENNRKMGSSGLDEEKIENMDQKLKAIEDLIIEEMVKYTGAHEGIRDMDEIRKLKDHVVSRLITAYSIEKMRRALDKLKQSYETEQHLKNNEIESDNSDEVDKKKRVAIKKEKAEFDNSNHKIEAATEKVVPDEPDNNLDENDDDKKKKKMKKSEYPIANGLDSDFEEELGAGHFYDPMLEGHGGGGRDDYSASSQCPLLDSIEKRCRDVDLLSGDIHQALLPMCGIHQLCYLCGTKQTACDFQYLSDADSICGHNNDCQSAARSALMILRGTPIPHLGPRECAKNSCLYRAMREVGL